MSSTITPDRLYPVQEQRLIPDTLVRLRDKYPIIRSLPDDWEKVRRLVAQGKEKEAEELIQARIAASPRLLIRNRVAVRHRILRREFLAYQRDLEKNIQSELIKLSDRIEKMLVNNADSDGLVGLAKLNGILDRLKTYNTEAWKVILILIKQGIRRSVQYGIDVTMKSAQQGIDDAEAAAKESDLKPVSAVIVFFSEAKKAVLSRTDIVYQTIFTRVQKARLKTGLFRKQSGTGLTISRRVWDVRDGHLTRMRRTIAAGIGNGRPATAIAKDVKGMTTIGQLSKAELLQVRPGSGVYKSAYKNALRLIRSETNQAYQEAEIEYAKAKGFKKMWNRSTGSNSPDVCDDLNGKIFDAEDVPPLPHPNCACFLTTVLPEIG